MNFSQFLGKLRQQINVEMESAASHLVRGSCVDMAEYKEKCGYIRGLECALAEIRYILREDVKPKPETEED